MRIAYNETPSFMKGKHVVDTGHSRVAEVRGGRSTWLFIGLAVAVTVAIPGLALAAAPVVDNATGATNVLSISAELQGALTSTGGMPTQVFVYWGESNGGTLFTSWEHTNDLGTNAEGALSVAVSNLTPNQTYYYRFYGTNADGAAWAVSTTNFQTLASSGPLAIDLRSCTPFMVLAATTITVPAGAGSIHGNVGLSPGVGSALLVPASLVIGTVYTVDATYALPPGGSVVDPVLLNNAHLDLTAAFNAASPAQLPGGIDVGDGELGGRVLAPGVYQSAPGSYAITLVDLTLNGGPDDVWVFQMASTLTVGTSRKVILAGGARAKNIFWQVGSSATLGVSSDFKGNILAYQDITMNGSSTMDGRALAQIGAVTYGASGGSLPMENSGPLAIQITIPATNSIYTSLTNLVDMGGWASDSSGDGVTLVTLRNSRDVAGFDAVGTALWSFDDLPVYQGTNFIEAIAYDILGNSATDTIQIVYNGDLLYDDVLRSGNIIQNIMFGDNLTPGSTVSVQWAVLSYVPVLCRIYAGVPGGWSFFRNGTYQGVADSPWNLNGRSAYIYSFDCMWPVPHTSGTFNVWFNVAQMDADQFMIPVIPDGIDGRPDPTYTKLIQRTIAAGGNGTIPTSDPDLWDSADVFESLYQHKERSAVTITSITMSDNLVQGASATCQWTVQSYLDVDAQVLMLNTTSSNVWLIADATQIGAPVETTFNFKDRTTGTTNYAKEYTFQATFTVPSQPGVQQMYFRSKDSTSVASLWMAENLAADVDPRPVMENAMYGRLIERTINP